MYLVPVRFPRREALWYLGGTFVALGSGLAVFAVTRHGGPDPGGGRAALSALAGNALFVAGSWVTGYIIQQQHAYNRALRDQAERDDRIRIARELHDVVAHGLSLIAVQAGVANWVAESQPAEAARALASIEEISRGALREMRALLGVLRVDNQADPALEPARGLADVTELADRVTAAGVAVTLDVRGTPAAMLPGLDLAAYRVIQEAVTNVIKHSGAGRCQVSVNYEADALTVQITDDGTASTDQPAGLGARADGHAGASGDVRRDVRGRPAAGRGFCRHRTLSPGKRVMIRVLVADDQVLLRGSLRLLVDSAPDLTAIGEASTGAEAVELATREKPDVILMDIRMPGMDGIEATQQITAAAETAGTRILVLTTFDLDEYVFAALRAGASGFLLKDTPPGDLLAAIRVAAAGDALLSPSVTRQLIGEFTRQPELSLKFLKRDGVAGFADRGLGLGGVFGIFGAPESVEH